MKTLLNNSSYVIDGCNNTEKNMSILDRYVYICNEKYNEFTAQMDIKDICSIHRPVSDT